MARCDPYEAMSTCPEVEATVAGRRSQGVLARESKYPSINMELLGPKYHTYDGSLDASSVLGPKDHPHNGFWTLCHDVWALAPSGTVRLELS